GRGGILVGVGAFGTVERLARGGKLGGGRRQAGTAGQCQRLRQGEGAGVQPGADLCEASVHGSRCVFSEDARPFSSAHARTATIARATPVAQGRWMDIGYFLRLMSEKGASDMFLTTGAPVYIKVEGRLYPLGDSPLPPGMVRK